LRIRRRNVFTCGNDFGGKIVIVVEDFEFVDEIGNVGGIGGVVGGFV
jgi:hypothetical protein